MIHAADCLSDLLTEIARWHSTVCASVPAMRTQPWCLHMCQVVATSDDVGLLIVRKRCWRRAGVEGITCCEVNFPYPLNLTPPLPHPCDSTPTRLHVNPRKGLLRQCRPSLPSWGLANDSRSRLPLGSSHGDRKMAFYSVRIRIRRCVLNLGAFT